MERFTNTLKLVNGGVCSQLLTILCYIREKYREFYDFSFYLIRQIIEKYCFSWRFFEFFKSRIRIAGNYQGIRACVNLLAKGFWRY